MKDAIPADRSAAVGPDHLILLAKARKSVTVGVSESGGVQSVQNLDRRVEVRIGDE